MHKPLKKKHLHITIYYIHRYLVFTQYKYKHVVHTYFKVFAIEMQFFKGNKNIPREFEVTHRVKKNL